MTERQDAEEEQELVRLYVLFGLLFRVAMVDMGKGRTVPFKISYDWFFQELSRWAEREHHQLRRLPADGLHFADGDPAGWHLCGTVPTSRICQGSGLFHRSASLRVSGIGPLLDDGKAEILCG